MGWGQARCIHYLGVLTADDEDSAIPTVALLGSGFTVA